MGLHRANGAQDKHVWVPTEHSFLELHTLFHVTNYITHTLLWSFYCYRGPFGGTHSSDQLSFDKLVVDILVTSRHSA